MIRICHVIGAMERAGAETFLMNLYRSIDRSKVQFDFLVHTDREAAYDAEILKLGGRIFRAPAITPTSLARLYPFYKKFFADHPEMIVVHGHIGSVAALYLRAAHKAGRYAIAHSHAQNYPLDFSQALFRILAFPTRFVADYYLGASFEAGLDRFGEKIVNSPRFKIIFNGVSVQLYAYSEEKRRKLRKELEISSDEQVLIHVARFDPVKNQTFLIDVFNEYYKLNPQSRLLMVGGGGSEGPTLRNKIENYQLTDVVKFLGIRSDVNDLLQAGDVFIMTSFSEGMPVAISEAQTAGLPCIVTTGFPEAANWSGEVRFVDLNAGIAAWVAAIKNAFQRSMDPHYMRSAGVERAQENGFDITTTARWFEDFYIVEASKRIG
ncbi:glycosyltransferase [Arcanobacterium phocisimile]|uniref:glycosyltransferase n=1 Tax=Arcanobacterium phocisimile TaxID=1302235 RepID=UPI001EF8728F|nr:glycosyltransferase [Arcanobacterium phocisimile]